MNEIIPLTPYV